MKILKTALALCAAIALIGLSTAQAGSDATITLTTDPAPPDMVPNPDGRVTICWEVVASTTPDHVVYALFDPSWVEVEHEIYQGVTGTNLCHDWQVPQGAPGGAYWVRVEYYSVEAGNEATAEVRFLVEDSPSPVEPATWGRIKSLF